MNNTSSPKGGKLTYVLVVAAALVVIGIYFYQRSAQPAKAPVVTTDETKNSETTNKESEKLATSSPVAEVPVSKATTTPNPKTTTGTYSAGEGDAAAPDIQVVEVDYDGTAFTPSTVTIKANDYVLFKNKSTVNFWPASDPHPTHTGYPGFDAGKSIAPGGRYTFQFTKIGSWGYHNHFNPSIRGTVVVTQ
jgi:plastocyanin